MDKPLPKANAETRPFWEACARGELLYQYCTACRRAQFYPRSHCSTCHGGGLEWRQSSGKGVVYTCTTVQRAPTPAFKALVPYVIALVDLEEGFRMMLNVLDCDPAQVAIGARVRVVFREEGGVALPQAVPA
jgi:uncharacterized protein